MDDDTILNSIADELNCTIEKMWNSNNVFNVVKQADRPSNPSTTGVMHINWFPHAYNQYLKLVFVLQGLTITVMLKCYCRNCSGDDTRPEISDNRNHRRKAITFDLSDPHINPSEKILEYLREVHP